MSEFGYIAERPGEIRIVLFPFDRNLGTDPKAAECVLCWWIGPRHASRTEAKADGVAHSCEATS